MRTKLLPLSVKQSKKNILSKRPLLSRLVIGLVFPLLITAIFIWQHLQRTIPFTMGNVKIDGIHATVEIDRDQNGVPFIRAKNDSDVYFAMGYVHAQDRLWQLELQRKLAQGRLSELFGRSSLSADVWIRTLGLYPSAEKAWLALSDEARQSLRSYKNGINAYLEQQHPLPIEFTLLNVKPEPWSEIDSLAWSKVFALNFSNGMWSELEHYIAKQFISDKQITQLLYATSNSDPVLLPTDLEFSDSYSSLLTIKSILENELHIGGPYVGSNAWAVSSELSDTGRPLLANDPHVGLQLPSLWYVAKQQGSTISSQGMSLVGLPLIIFGKNDHIAWAGTSLMADVQDLYFEEVHPDNMGLYKYGDKWLSFTQREETIHIKPDFPAFLNKTFEPVKIKIRETRNGPIVSDAIEGAPRLMALKWTALRDTDTTYDAFFAVNHAKNWLEFSSALELHVAPALNMLFVDSDNVGYRAAGAIPIRSTGQGMLPLPGWNTKNQWIGDIPTAEMPNQYAPESGYIVSANNRITNTNYPHFISAQWAPPFRAQRIHDLINKSLSVDGKVSVADFKAMQGDTLDLGAINLVKRLQIVEPETARQKQLLSLLTNWSGDMSANSSAAALFTIWVEQLRVVMFSDNLKGYFNQPSNTQYLNSILNSVSTLVLYNILSDDNLNWCDDITSLEKESCDSQMLKALNSADKKISKLLGSSPSDWSWGKIHSTAYTHQPFSNINIIRKIFDRNVPNGGSPDTINVASGTFDLSERYRQDFGAGFRQIMQVGADDLHLYMNSTGQSGNPNSSHYDDMVKPFNALQFYELSDPKTNARTEQLILSPKGKSNFREEQ